MQVRLDTVARDLVELVGSAGDLERRRAAVAAAEFALERSGLRDQRADDGLQAVREGRVGDSPERSAVEALATALDERQWDLQDRVASGEAPSVEHLDAFGRARAASSVFYAAEADARTAALEAIYEASAVVDDVDDLRSVVVPLLT